MPLVRPHYYQIYLGSNRWLVTNESVLERPIAENLVWMIYVACSSPLADVKQRLGLINWNTDCYLNLRLNSFLNLAIKQR
jgi:hypothetical protein